MSFFLLVSTVAFVAALLILYWLHSQAWLDVQTPHVSPPPDGPLVSVLVPARNEERNIRRCVEALLVQDYPHLEIIVLDDRSTDAPPAILSELARRDSRLVILAGNPLPPGWAGKPHALYQAARRACGEWLLFLDADTFLHPNAVSAALAAAKKTGADLYTVLTEQLTGSFWERAVMPLVMTALSVGFSPRRVNNPHTRDAIANGQFILIKRTVYDAVGGHERLKNQIVEDKALAEQVKWNRYRLIVADGRGVAQTRMYTSLPEMWEGWTKNIYLGLADTPAMLLLGAFGAFLALMAALVLPLWPLAAVVWYRAGGGWMALTVLLQALTVWGTLLVARMRVNAHMGIPLWYVVTTPLGAAVFAAMMLASAWKVLSGQGVTWKGRTYASKTIR
ncbi:MAG: glycosyltransferase family 2 protein [Anaerolineales bacterium]|nr:glycosyltransferase family 2 protein [Anaerolineales bacterium]